MPVFFRTGCVFVHIPKTSGQSIFDCFQKIENNLTSKNDKEFRHFSSISFSEYVEAVSKLDISSLTHATSCHLLTQSQFIYNENKLTVDYVGRYEFLDKAMSEISKIIDHEIILPHLNKSEDCKIDLDKNTKKLIHKMYQQDFDLLKY